MSDLKEPERPVTPRASNGGPFIGFTLKTSTWVSNSHGLYDYESHHVSAKTYRCHGRSNSYRILRKGVDVTLVTEPLGCAIVEGDPDVQTIARLIALEDGGYCLEPIDADDDYHLRRAHSKSLGRYPPAAPTEQETARLAEDLRLWTVLRSVKDGSLPLTEGDVIKLGRLAFRVRQIVLNDQDERTILSNLCSGSGDEEDDEATCGSRRSERCVPPPVGVSDQRMSQSLPDSHLRAPSLGSAFESHAEPLTDWPPKSDRCSDSSSVNGTTDPNSQGPVPPQAEKSAEEEFASPVSESGPQLCRVCLCEEEESTSDPLVSPCKCAGSMKWIHLKCLRRWMEGRLNIKSDESGNTCFFWRPLECELCQESYPTYIDLDSSAGREKAIKEDPVSRALRASGTRTDGNLVELFEIPRPAIPFVVLESKHQPSGMLGFHFISFQRKETIQLGRGHEADIRVPDISVSRLHAAMRYQPDPEQLSSILRSSEALVEPCVGEERILTPLGGISSLKDMHRPYVYMEDLKSKFGTLVAVRRPILLFPRMMISVQVGRTVLTLYIRKPTWSRLLPSCLQIHYRGLVPRRLRRRRQSASDASHGESDTYDVRLVETFVPLAIMSGEQANTDMAVNNRVEEDELPPPPEADTHPVHP